jgi:hypothetical protein
MGVKEIAFRLDTARVVTTRADFTYSITPNTIAIVDTGKGGRSVTNDIGAVLRKIEVLASRLDRRVQDGRSDGTDEHCVIQECLLIGNVHTAPSSA